MKQIGERKNDVFVFGAHVFSQLPFCFGLDESKINCVLDNSEIKNGKRLYGTGLYVKNPDVIKDCDNPIVIVNVGNYKKEICKQLKLINSNVIILQRIDMKLNGYVVEKIWGYEEWIINNELYCYKKLNLRKDLIVMR